MLQALQPIFDLPKARVDVPDEVFKTVINLTSQVIQATIEVMGLIDQRSYQSDTNRTDLIQLCSKGLMFSPYPFIATRRRHSPFQPLGNMPKSGDPLLGGPLEQFVDQRLRRRSCASSELSLCHFSTSAGRLS